MSEFNTKHLGWKGDDLSAVREKETQVILMRMKG